MPHRKTAIGAKIALCDQPKCNEFSRRVGNYVVNV